jgi:anti-sigma factor RsiW
MMNDDAQLKLQAYLDGELSQVEARQVEDSLAGDPEAAALLQELRQTSQALQGFEHGVRLPESREFYWSKIAREIRRQEQPQARREPGSLVLRVQRWFLPASAVALLTLVLTLSVGRSTTLLPGEMELMSPEMAALTFRSQAEGITMVWLYPRNEANVPRENSPIDLDLE